MAQVAQRLARGPTQSALCALRPLRRVVHRKGEELLRGELPPKQEHIIKLQLSYVQQSVYQAYLEVRGGEGGRGEPIGASVSSLESLSNWPFRLPSRL